MSRSRKKVPVTKWSTDKRFVNRQSRRKFKDASLDVTRKDLKYQITDLCLTPLIEYLLYNERDVERYERDKQTDYVNRGYKPPKRTPKYKYYMK